MSTEEDRLAQLLKRIVPEPPVQLSADEIATQPTRPSAKSWTMPALAAAAVVAIGVTVGLLAAHRPGPGAGAGRQAVSGTSRSASPQTSATCQGPTVIVPNVIGESMNTADAAIRDIGLNVATYDATPPGSVHVPAGSVIAQTPPAGSKAVPGAEVKLGIASSPSASTAAPIDPGKQPTASPCPVVTGTPAAVNASPSVPNLVGMGNNQATRSAHAAGFTVTKVVTPAPASRPVPPGMVVAQTPAAGSTARAGSGMILYAAPGS